MSAYCSVGLWSYIDRHSDTIRPFVRIDYSFILAMQMRAGFIRCELILPDHSLTHLCNLSFVRIRVRLCQFRFILF